MSKVTLSWVWIVLCLGGVFNSGCTTLTAAVKETARDVATRAIQDYKPVLEAKLTEGLTAAKEASKDIADKAIRVGADTARDITSDAIRELKSSWKDTKDDLRDGLASRRVELKEKVDSGAASKLEYLLYLAMGGLGLSGVRTVNSVVSEKRKKIRDITLEAPGKRKS
jgi:hypothetical protein